MKNALRTTLRSLARQPGISLAVVLTLALGIGAGTALFAYLVAIVWPALDAPDSDRAVWIYTGTEKDPRESPLISTTSICGSARARSATSWPPELRFLGRPWPDVTFAWGQFVSGEFFPFFGARPEIGRLLQPGDDRLGSEPVIVVSHSFWQGVLGGDPQVVGQPLRINGSTFTLVGVTRKGFQGQGRPTPLYVPISQAERVTGIPRFEKREFGWLVLFGRRAPATSLAQTQTALDVAAHALDAAAPWREGKKRRITAIPVTFARPRAGRRSVPRRCPDPDGGGGPLPAPGCANVANLLLARATARQREWAIRASLGASRWRLARAVLAESLLLCLVGGALGLPFAAAMSRRLEGYAQTSPGGLGSWSGETELVRLDLRAFAFALVAALLCALLCSLAPALRALRGDLVAPVKSDAAGATGGPSGALGAAPVAGGAPGGPVGAPAARRQPAGAHPAAGGEGRSGVQSAPSHARHPLRAAQQRPRDAGGRRHLPEGPRRRPAAARRHRGQPLLQPAAHWLEPYHPGVPHDRAGSTVEVAYNLVAPGYFETLGIPIVQGRPLDLHDRQGATPAVVVNRALARKLWGAGNPIGRTLTLADPPQFGDAGPTFEVVGVASDARIDSLIQPPGPLMDLAFEQRFHPRITLTVRSALPLAALAPEIRRAVGAAHPDVSVVDLLSLDEQIERSLDPAAHARRGRRPVRPARAAGGGGRPVQPAELRGEPADARDRHPHGGGSRTARGARGWCSARPWPWWPPGSPWGSPPRWRSPG